MTQNPPNYFSNDTHPHIIFALFVNEWGRLKYSIESGTCNGRESDSLGPHLKYISIQHKRPSAIQIPVDLLSENTYQEAVAHADVLRRFDNPAKIRKGIENIDSGVAFIDERLARDAIYQAQRQGLHQ